MMGLEKRTDDRRFRSREDKIDYNLIYAISFATCLAAAAGVRFTHWSSHHPDGEPQARKSLFEQARSDASTVVEFAFMQ